MKIYKVENFTKHLDRNFSIKLKNDNYKTFVSDYQETCLSYY